MNRIPRPTRNAALSLVAWMVFFWIASVAAVAEDNSTAPAPIAWSAIGGSHGYQVDGRGDAESEAGAALRIASIEGKRAPFGGAIARLDLSRYRGREVELEADVQVLEGSGTAAIWIRADRNEAQAAFATSAYEPVHAGDAQTRRIRTYIPVHSTLIVFGGILEGPGSARISDMRVHALASSGTGADAYEVLESAFVHVEHNAFNVARADLPGLRQRLLLPSLRSMPSMEAYAPIATLLAALQDRHSFAMPPSRARESRRTGTLTSAFEHRLIDGQGYLRIPGFMGTDPGGAARFSREICDAMASMAPRAQGWIVDLRANTGGNMWPMLAGLKPLLGDAEPGRFRNREGRETPWWVEDAVSCTVVPVTDAPVAVLFGGSTASSGEAVAVAFSGRPRTRSFGQPTAGVSTANVGYDLPDGGSLMLTASVDVDRTGRAFPAGLSPDEVIPASTDDGADPGLDAALAWLRGR